MPDFSFNQLGDAFKSVSSTLLGTNQVTGAAARPPGTVTPASDVGLFGQVEGLLSRGYGVYDTFKNKGRAPTAPRPSQFIQEDKTLIYIAGGGLALVVVALLLGRK